MEKMKEKDDDDQGLTMLQRSRAAHSPTLFWPSNVVGSSRMFPFTSSQWQELQRQALIYKHMAASVPIPLHLLLPSSASSFPQSPTMNLRFKNGMMDPEPGRCRRTDGKKWRCAKGAEPDQKYCEKHLNRKRPRSRKLVEQLRLQPPRKVSRCDPNIELKLPFRSVESNGEQPRCQDWAMGYSENLSSNRQWEMRHSCTGLKYNKKSATEQYEELPRLNYNDASGSWCDFRNPYPSPLDETAVHNNEKLPARSIDAWSTASTATTISPNESSVLTKDKLSPSTLTLTMSNTIEERTDLQLPMGFGGPLGEVLQSRSNVASPCDGSIELINLMCMGHETCPQDSPLVSSSSGILQKGFVLPSDNSNSSSSSSSSSSSPSFDVASRSDFAFKWMNFN